MAVAPKSESQMNGQLLLEDGTPSPAAAVLGTLDLMFTGVFTFELLCNLYAHWMIEFISDGWCIFDFFVVSVSLIAPFMSDQQVPMTIFRLLRACRAPR